VQERFGDFTFIEARLHTGRTHQIRVHAAHIGHPVVGDPVYGQRTARRHAPKHDPDLEDLIDRLGGQALHAHFMTFVHPRSGEALCFHAPLPEEIQRVLDYLRARTP
jgi:23S rRNA pseudouridine1911/1915/1917 synthase